MAIQAIGTRSQVILPPAQQARESANSRDVQAGNIQVAPETEQSSTRDYEAEYGPMNSHDEQSRLQQFLTKFEESVTDQIQTAREENKITEILSEEEVDQAEQTFKADIAEIRKQAGSGGGSSVDVSFVSQGVLDSINKLASSLKFTIDGMLPSVPPQPFKAEYPPEPELPSVGPQSPEEILSQGVDELA